MKLTDMKLTTHMTHNYMRFGFCFEGVGRADGNGPRVRLRLQEIFYFLKYNPQRRA